MSSFPMTAAQLSGNFCQTLFYGVYLVTCAFCARTLLITGSGRDERWARPHEIRWMMAIIALIFFIISTFDVAIGLLHNYQAFVRSDDPNKVFSDIGYWIDIVRSTDQAIAMTLGDFVLIYRCWIVYGRRWQVIVPSVVLYLGGTASIIRLLAIMGQQAGKDNIDSLAADETTPWFLAFYAITAVQNMLTTSIMILRIWRVWKESEGFLNSAGSSTYYQPHRLRQVIRVIAESGAAYTASVLVTFIIAATQSNGLYPASDITIQAVGIAFNIILIRSSPRRDQQFTTFDQRTTGTFIESANHGNKLLGTSISLGERSQPRDVKLATIGKSDHRAYSESSQEDIDKTSGVKVTTTVVKS